MRPVRSPFMRRLLPALGAGGALSLAVYGVTAANTVPDSKAGAGSGTITGYTVTGVTYDLNATDPQNIDAVKFTVNAAPPTGSEIEVRLVSSGSTWYSCTNTGTAVTCNTTSPAATVTSADELTVVAVD